MDKITAPQTIRLHQPDQNTGEVTFTMPIDVGVFGYMCARLAKAGYEFVPRDPSTAVEIADVPDWLAHIADAAWQGLHIEGEHHKQEALAEILALCGGSIPEGMDMR